MTPQERIQRALNEPSYKLVWRSGAKPSHDLEIFKRAPETTFAAAVHGHLVPLTLDDLQRLHEAVGQLLKEAGHAP